MSGAGHYHVDVFAGPKEKFVRGFTLQRDANGAYVVYDDFGLAGTPKAALSDPLPLDEALRVALVKMHPLIEKPLRPVWSAPFALLGYTRQTFRQRLRKIFRRDPTEFVVGPDGRPEKYIGSVELEVDHTGVAAFWAGPDQLRLSAAFFAALVRTFERRPGANVGIADPLYGGAAADLTALADAEVRDISRRNVQDAEVLIDGERSAYAFRTDGVGAGMLCLDVPEDRRAALWDVVEAEVARFRAAGHDIYIPGMP